MANDARFTRTEVAATDFGGDWAGLAASSTSNLFAAWGDFTPHGVETSYKIGRAHV